eukprot:5139300-Prymnesium_polylepis.1
MKSVHLEERHRTIFKCYANRSQTCFGKNAIALGVRSDGRGGGRHAHGRTPRPAPALPPTERMPVAIVLRNPWRLRIFGTLTRRSSAQCRLRSRTAECRGCRN